ncbi:phosphatase PAP2 family protein [Candidatus Woesearchaeota archaeon]|nr:phosphatase PAP2 family protein [Candidatus Woesearchaeota archaeon]
MKTKVLLLLVALLGLLSFTLDTRIFAVASSIKHPVLSYIMQLFSNVISIVVVLLITASLFMRQERKKKWIKALLLSSAASSAVSILLKFVVARPRPEHAAFVFTQYSFPSMHAAVAFSLLPVLEREFPALKRFWLLPALLVAFSRLYLGAHYFSDVVWGAIIGYLIGKGVVMLQEAKKLEWLAWKNPFR